MNAVFRRFAAVPEGGRLSAGAAAMAAVLLPVLALGVERVSRGVLGPFSWTFFYPAVLLVAVLAGGRAGMASTGLSALLGAYFFLEPSGAFAEGHGGGLASVAVFVATGLGMSWLRRRVLDGRRHRPDADWEEQYRCLFENMSCGACVYGAVDGGGDFVFRAINPAAEAIEGIARQAVVGRRLTEVFPGVHEFGLLETLQRVWRTGEPDTLPASLYWDARISGWRENRVYKLPTGEVVAVYEDVTPLRDAVQRLDQQRALYERILANVRDGIWLSDSGHRVSYANPALRELFGLETGDLIGIDLGAESAIPIWKSIEPFYRQVQSLEAPLAYEVAVTTPQGDEVWRTGWLVPLTDSGQFAGVIGTMRDITGFKRAETALRENEMRFQTLVEHAPDSFFIHRSDGRFIDVNRRACEDLGFSRDELLQLHVWDVDADLCLDAAATHWQSLEFGQSRTLSSHYRRKDGSRFPVEIRLSCCDSGGQRIFLALVRDVSERRHAEQVLALHAEMCRHMAEGVILVRASDCRIVLANPGAERMFGYEPGELVGKPDDLLHMPSARFPAAGADAIAAGIEHAGQWHGEMEVQRKEGGSVWCSVTVTQFEQPGHGRVRLSVYQDISEFRETQVALELHREHLADLVEARTLELEKARQEAERLARAKADFLANMSHEIRTPLNAILGFAQVGQKDNADRRAARTFEHILESGQLLLGIISDILDFSKTDAGKLVLEDGIYDPGRLVDRAAALVSDRAFAKGLEFRIEKGADLPHACRGDSLRLAQILANLLSNAIKFTDRGSVVLAAEVEGEELVFRVTDTGIGIPEAGREMLFQPFEQADGGITRRFGGTGLGLAISKRLVDLMAGKIEITSRPGLGSRFEVRIPLVKAKLEEEPAGRCALEPVHPGAARLVGIRVLAAEDNEINRLLLEEMLGDEGCELVLVEDGRMAVETVQAAGAGSFDVVLMDIEMPELDGYAATRQLHDLDPGLPVIGLTAHALPEVKEACRKAGMIEHVSKPFELGMLLDCLCKAARRREPEAGGEAGYQEAPDEPIRASDGAQAAARYRPLSKAPRRLLRTLSGYAGETGLLRCALRDGDLQRLAFLSHSLGRITGQTPYANLHELSRETEQAARMERDDAVELGALMAAALEKLLVELSV